MTINSNGSSNRARRPRIAAQPRLLLLLLLLVLVQEQEVSLVSAAYMDGYVDPTFECPARTTCKPLCVPVVEYCPEGMRCQNETQQLCADGSCRAECSSTLVSPCSHYGSCAPVACARVVAPYNVCTQVYGPLYEEMAAVCSTWANQNSTSLGDNGQSWTGPAYIVGYTWLATVTLGIITWCWFNNRWFPVKGSTKVLQLRMETSIRNDPDAAMAQLYQTGYHRRHVVGNLLHGMTILTFFGWYALLAYTTYLTYQQEASQDYILHALRTFSFLYNVGFFWNLALYWPYSIESLFYRRSNLAKATMVAVHYQKKIHNPNHNHHLDKTQKKDNNQYHCATTNNCPFQPTRWMPPSVTHALNRIGQCLGMVMSFIFAEPINTNPVNGGVTEVRVEYCTIRQNPDDGSRYFVFLFRRYNYDEKQELFVPGSWSIGKTFAEMRPQRIQNVEDFARSVDQQFEHTDTIPEESSVDFCIGNAAGLTPSEVTKRRQVVGLNVIEMTRPSLWGIFRTEISKPFYLYQFQILWIWITIQYWYMMIANWCVILLSACTISWFRYRSAKVLYALSHIDGFVTILREDEFVELHQSEVVPGDIVHLAPGVIQSDMVLLTGEAIVDESALSGEATPHAKLHVDLSSEEIYDPTIHKRQTLSAGTTIVESRQAIALVTQTASFTRKGELLRDVIAFRRHQVQYELDLPYAVLFLVCYSILLWILVYFKASDVHVVAWYLGLCAVANSLPPLLPLSFTLPLGYSFERLSKEQVVCSNSDGILMAGEVTKCFFDKTGTLTRQGLDYTDCRSAEKSKFVHYISPTVSIAMASCHTLVMSSQDGKLIGNPVDRAMFMASHAVLLGKGEKIYNGSSSSTDQNIVTIVQQDGTVIEVLRRFDFDHCFMTQSVVVRFQDGSVMAIAKGSGESIRNICHQESVPGDFDDSLVDFAKIGMYQIAVAFKKLPSSMSDDNVALLTREQVEEDMSFAGMLSFTNKLRRKSAAVISSLIEAGICPVMLTGDNLYTGIHVARESRIIGRESAVLFGVIADVGLEVAWLCEDGNRVDNPSVEELEFGKGRAIVAMTGEAWRLLLRSQPAYASALAPYIRVVGRCTPHDKVSVVDTFVLLGFKTFMVGDGSNDAGALRAAHSGLALSNGDASLVAPFTSLNKDIESVLTVLKEGRATLHSTLAVYKYIILYGNITSYCQVITYWLQASFTDWMWTFLDGIWTVLFCLTLPLARPANLLSKSCPTASLLSPQTVLSICGIILLNYAAMGWALGSLYSKDWFQCRKWNADDFMVQDILMAADNYETEVVFLVVTAQCISAGMTSNFGYEYRQAWYRNYLFVLISLGATAIHVYITLVPSSLSCFWRVNCDNDNLVRGVTQSDPEPIHNPFNTTVMPVEFRYELLAIMIFNGLAVAAFDYFLVNGIRQAVAKRGRQNDIPVKTPPRSPLKSRKSTTSTFEMIGTESFRPNTASAAFLDDENV